MIFAFLHFKTLFLIQRFSGQDISFTLNETGADMLKLFMEGKDIHAVIQAIAEMYDAPIEVVTNDVTAFAETQKEKGLILGKYSL